MLARRTVLLLALLAACTTDPGAPTETLGTVGVIVPDSPPTTLLPDVVNTDPPDVTDTVAPQTMFGGDPCSALQEADFPRVVIGGVGPGQLIDFGALAPDTCGYTVHADRQDFDVVVGARPAQDFTQPPAPAGVVPETLTGIGAAAVGFVQADGTYLVIVQVDNGYFSVKSPDAASAQAYATVAAGRALLP